MAERRMFAKTIVDSDSFLDMPLSTQAVYFHLSMRADDEGFINNPRKIMRMVGAGEDEIKLLIAKRFILDMEDGIVVIKHWRMHNYIQKDRFKATVHTEKREKLTLKKNNVYTMDTECIQDVDTGKGRLGKSSLVEDSIDAEIEISSPAKNVAFHLLNKIKANKPNFKEPNIDTWTKDIDKAIRIDKRTEQELMGCIDWIYSDAGSFWIPNILSGKKLREKFDTMESQMMSKKKKTDGLDAMLEAYNAS